MRNEQRLLKLRIGQMWSLASIVILAMWTSGCATATFSKYQCPTLKSYTKEFQLKAAEEKRGPASQQLVSDYGQLRDACRALEATK